MPVSLKDFLKTEPRKPEPASCGHILDVVDKEGHYKIDGNQVCQACYFECLGSEIEKHPIGHLALHSGCANHNKQGEVK